MTMERGRAEAGWHQATETPCETVRKLLGEARCLTLTGSRLLLSRMGCFPGIEYASRTRRATESLVTRGVALARFGLWKDAMGHWQKALEIDAHNADALNNLAVAYEREGQYELAKARYEAALAVEPMSVYIRQNYEINQQLWKRSGLPEPCATNSAGRGRASWF